MKKLDQTVSLYITHIWYGPHEGSGLDVYESPVDAVKSFPQELQESWDWSRLCTKLVWSETGRPQAWLERIDVSVPAAYAIMAGRKIKQRINI